MGGRGSSSAGARGSQTRGSAWVRTNYDGGANRRIVGVYQSGDTYYGIIPTMYGSTGSVDISKSDFEEARKMGAPLMNNPLDIPAGLGDVEGTLMTRRNEMGNVVQGEYRYRGVGYMTQRRGDGYTYVSFAEPVPDESFRRVEVTRYLNASDAAVGARSAIDSQIRRNS